MLKRPAIIGTLLFGGLLSAAAWVRRAWLVITVRGSSMHPTFVDGHRVLARRQSGEACRPGDVVVFAACAASAPVDPIPGDPVWRIKRVVALADDPVPEWMSSPGRVPAGHLVVVGDNPVSQGSQQLGFIPHAAVLGVVPTRRRKRKAT